MANRKGYIAYKQGRYVDHYGYQVIGALLFVGIVIKMISVYC